MNYKFDIRFSFGLLFCSRLGTPEPNITWTKDSATINRRIGQVHYRKWAIVLEELMQTDSGDYTCHVCNVHKCINYTTRLEVKGERIMYDCSRYNTIIHSNILRAFS